MKKLSKYKYIILTNTFIILCYLLIHTVPELFGIDDSLANSYIYRPNSTILDNLIHISGRTYWNMRVGEIFYFIIGCFPRYFYFFFNAIRVLFFYNLVFIYTYGIKTKKYFFTKKYIICLITSFLLTITIYPAFSETFIWMAGTYNHLFDLIAILIVFLPFRLLIDGYDIIKNNKKIGILYLVLSIISAFTLEHVVPCVVLFDSVLLSFFFFREKKTIKEFINKYLYYILSIIVTCLSLLFFFLSTATRIKFFSIDSFVSKTGLFQEVLEKYSYLLVLTLVLIIAVLFIKKLKIKEFIFNVKSGMFLLLIGILSIVLVYFSPAYYSARETLLIFFSLLIIINYLLSELLQNNIIFIIFMVLSVALITIITYRLRVFYFDFNDFNRLRKEYIIEQYNNNYPVIYCPLYDNRMNYFFAYRLSSYEDFFCDASYTSYYLEDDSILSFYTFAKIRKQG